MGNRKYPRLDHATQLKPTSEAQCRATGCTAKATHTVWVQFSYMRGDDECVKACNDHRKLATREDASAFVALFPTEAWK